jgi:hypothetical protein
LYWGFLGQFLALLRGFEGIIKISVASQMGAKFKANPGRKTWLCQLINFQLIASMV